MREAFKLKQDFQFPPEDPKEARIMKYIEFLEIEALPGQESPGIFYQAGIDPKAVRGDSRFAEFIDKCGDLETESGRLGNIFLKSRIDDSQELVFFMMLPGSPYLIDHEGFLHLGTAEQYLEPERFRFVVTCLRDYYGFRIYEEERRRIQDTMEGD